MKIRWAEGTPERAGIELWVRLVQALRLKQLVDWLMVRLERS